MDGATTTQIIVVQAVNQNLVVVVINLPIRLVQQAQQLRVVQHTTMPLAPKVSAAVLVEHAVLEKTTVQILSIVNSATEIVTLVKPLLARQRLMTHVLSSEASHTLKISTTVPHQM